MSVVNTNNKTKLKLQELKCKLFSLEGFICCVQNLLSFHKTACLNRIFDISSGECSYLQLTQQEVVIHERKLMESSAEIAKF